METSDVKNVFTPEPTNRHDVIWFDRDGGQYLVHSQILRNRSAVFRDLEQSKEVVQ